jgi:hypothetical protein
VHYI